MNELRQLLRPWIYLGISGPRKYLFDWIIPAILALVFIIPWAVSGVKVQFYGAGGFLSQITSFVQNLPGFFIAALAAVATFNRGDLDKEMPEPAPTIPVAIKGHAVRLSLTRRRFLCVLFAFLTVQSIVITLVGVLLVVLAPAISHAVGDVVRPFVYYTGAFLYLFQFLQMIIATALGLYYLGDRIHQPDS